MIHQERRTHFQAKATVSDNEELEISYRIVVIAPRIGIDAGNSQHGHKVAVSYLRFAARISIGEQPKTVAWLRWL